MSEKIDKIEIAPGRQLNMSKSLCQAQHNDILQMLQKYQDSFSWDYTDMKGLDPTLYTHRIYISPNCKPVRQLQRRINPTL